MTDLRPPVVLVVNDHEASRYMSTRTLAGAGFRTLETEMGRAAIEIAQRELPDVVLLDIKLPDIDGFEVCRRLREHPATSSLAIVQMSATFETAEYRVRGLEGGADTFLVEPVEPTVLVATVRAMLRLRQAEAQLREFDRRKDEFLATVAHELRNPLAPLRSCLDLLDHDAAKPGVLDKCLQMMRRQTDHLIRLVDDLADMSRITQNKLTLRIEPADLGRVVEMAVEAQRADAAAKGQDLVVSLPDEPVSLNADAIRLAQVFGNLLSNSIKYTPAGGRIEVHARLEPPGEAVLEFTDTGSGIAPEDLARVFELFVQAGRQGSGLGIGLALVHRIVTMHGGTVEAESAGISHGSKFIVRLPVGGPGSGDHARLPHRPDADPGTHSGGADGPAQARGRAGGPAQARGRAGGPAQARGRVIRSSSVERKPRVAENGAGSASPREALTAGTSPAAGTAAEPSAGTAAAEMPAAAARGVTQKVLVVDDNIDAVDSMANLLRAMGRDVRVAYGGRDALSIGDEFRPDLILMDLSMPGLDGFETIGQVRQRPWSRDTFICTLSGHGQTHSLRAVRAGADVHLVKPVSRADLLRALEYAAGRGARN